jgi:hypothetical protein
MCVPSLCTALEPLPCTNIAPRGHKLLICASAAPAFPSESGIGTLRLPARERIMRILTLLIGAAALFAVAAPAAAASRADWDACNGDDPDRSIAACTRIIQGRGETAKDSAIAHQRGLAYRNRAISTAPSPTLARRSGSSPAACWGCLRFATPWRLLRLHCPGSSEVAQLYQ